MAKCMQFVFYNTGREIIFVVLPGMRLTAYRFGALHALQHFMDRAYEDGWGWEVEVLELKPSWSLKFELEIEARKLKIKTWKLNLGKLDVSWIWEAKVWKLEIGSWIMKVEGWFLKSEAYVKDVEVEVWKLKAAIWKLKLTLKMGRLEVWKLKVDIWQMEYRSLSLKPWCPSQQPRQRPRPLPRRRQARKSWRQAPRPRESTGSALPTQKILQVIFVIWYIVK